MVEHEGPPLPVPPPAVWGVWYEGGDGDPPGWSDLCPSEAEARNRLVAGVLPEHRHRYRVAVAGVAPGRLATAEAERDALMAFLVVEQRQASGRPTYSARLRLSDFFLTREAALAAVRKAAGLGGHADALG
jgi:hypothetical protein